MCLGKSNYYDCEYFVSKWSKLIELWILAHSGVHRAGAAVATQSHSGNKSGRRICHKGKHWFGSFNASKTIVLKAYNEIMNL